MAGSYNLGIAEGTIRINYDGSGSKKAQADLDVTEAKGKKNAASWEQVGRASLIASAAIAAGVGYATVKAVDFEKEISAIGAVSGASNVQLDAMRKKALQLGADTSFSASEAASAMEELAKAGISTTDILGGAADATVALAAAGGIALPDAATIAANAMNQFGLSAKELPHIADLIAGAANASAIDVGQLGQSMQQAGAVAHLAGLSFADTAVAIAEMGNAGIRGSDAGTSLKTFLQNLIPQTKQQIALFKQLGLTTKNGGNAFFDASGKVKSLADVSQILQNALKGQSKEQQLATLQTLFGTDAIRAAAVLADNGAKGFNDLAAAMGKTTAADVAAARLNNTAGKIEQLKGSVETAAIAFGELLLPLLNRVASALTSFANALNGLSERQKNAILIVLAVAGGILLLVGVISKIIAIVRVFQTVWIALNASFIATPIGAIITAVVLLVAAIYLLWTRSSAFRNFFIGLWNDIWGFLKTIGAWFAGPFANFFVGIWNKIWPVFKAIGDAAVAVWQFIVGGVKFYWGIIQSVLNFFAPLFNAVFGLITAIVKTAFAIIGAIIQVGVLLWRTFIEPPLMAIWAVIRFVLNAIWTTWKFIFDNMANVIRATWSWIGPYVMFALNVIWSAISTFVGIVRSIWSAIWNAVRSTISIVWNTIVSIISGAIGNIIGIINGIKAIVERVRTFFNQLKEAASGGVGSLISFVSGIPGRILGAIGNLGSLLYNAGRSIIEGLINGIKSMVGAVKDAVSNVLQKARDLLPFSPAKEGPFSGKGWTLYSGQSISDALAAGIADHADAAVNATVKLAQRVNAVIPTPASPLTGQFSYQAGTTIGAAAPVAPAIVNNSVTVNAPAPIVDPEALATYAVRRLNSSMATRSIQPATA